MINKKASHRTTNQQFSLCRSLELEDIHRFIDSVGPMCHSRFMRRIPLRLHSHGAMPYQDVLAILRRFAPGIPNVLTIPLRYASGIAPLPLQISFHSFSASVAKYPSIC